MALTDLSRRWQKEAVKQADLVSTRQRPSGLAAARAAPPAVATGGGGHGGGSSEHEHLLLSSCLAPEIGIAMESA